MSPMFHKPDVFRCGVYTLAILYWSLKHVTELGLVSKVIGTNEVYHAPVFDQIVLQRISSQNNASFCADLLQSLE